MAIDERLNRMQLPPSRRSTLAARDGSPRPRVRDAARRAARHPAEAARALAGPGPIQRWACTSDRFVPVNYSPFLSVSN